MPGMFDLPEADVKQSAALSPMREMGHEQVTFCYDEKTGLRAIIAIHNTVLGPSLGGTCMWNYAKEEDALHDVLRLSRGMTYKSAISGLNLGGGKAVIIGDSKTGKSEALLRRFGQFIDGLNGRYITAEDVGMSTQDIQYISMKTKHVAGLPEEMGGGGDPSPVTAYGVYMGIKGAAKVRWGTDSLEGRKVLVQGVGHVGEDLVALLEKENAVILISDINQDRLKALSAQYKVEIVDKDAVYDTEMDIYAPCALGATLNDQTIPKLKCQVVAGSANNQLDDEKRNGSQLIDRDILYAPDFLINAGGIINCYSEQHNYNRKAAYSRTEKIYDTLIDLIEHAKQENITPHEAALRLAQRRIQSINDLKSSYKPQ